VFISNLLCAEGETSTSLVFGTIKHKGEPLPMTAVYLKGTTTGTASNADGKYWLYLNPGKHTLVFQALGFESQTIELNLAVKESLNIDVELKELIVMMDPITVGGSRIGLLRYLPGSVNVVDNKHQELRQLLSNTDAFRHVPGLHTADEDPAGLRTNIGIRGLDPDRSRSQLVLEDGVPVALGPYGEPELYYSPAIERMSGVEILKGNGQILYGPQTIGGVINYLTADPPSESTGNVSINGSEGGFFSGKLHLGNTFGTTGYTFDYLRKQADQLGPLKFRLNDITGKIRIKSGPRSVLSIKWSIYDETSNATYIGLTQPMYEAGSDDFTVLTPHDKLDIRRYALSIQHSHQLSDKLSLRQMAYAYTTIRNWKRQDFSYSPNVSGLTGITWGDPTQAEGAIFMRNSTGNRNRAFEVAGYESRLTYNYTLANLTHQLDVGFRLHTERAFEQRINGRLAEARSGELREDEVRNGRAGSVFAQQKTRFGQQIILTYGIRAERLGYVREIHRLAGKDTLIRGLTRTFVLIPGAGLNYNLNDNAGLFAGIHKGFAPPRIKDAISNSGQDVQLDAETSINTELGFRFFQNGKGLSLTAFHMNFGNQVIPVSESSGGQGAGLVNGGRTTHKGLEANFTYQEQVIRKIQLETGISSTLLKSHFGSDRFVIQKIRKTAPVDTIWVNVKGKRTPYAPEFLASAWMQLTHQNGISAYVSWQVTGKQFTDMLNTVSTQSVFEEAAANPDYRYTAAVANGRIGLIPAYQTLNLRLGFEIPKTNMSFCLNFRNLLNERYIITRRPQGIRVGIDRMIIAGLDWKF
jgi:Fe(3+) dicitrate transport protein